jgi:hypothetical protein
MNKTELFVKSNKLFLSKYFNTTKNISPIFISRWTVNGISNSKNNINKIIDRNNEDHCGVCDKNFIEFTKNDEIDYYLPFVI